MPTEKSGLAVSRRSMLRTSAALTAGAIGVPRLLHALAPYLGARASAARPPIGLQLYTVRTLMQADLPGTFAAIAEAGVREVEFAGYFEHTPLQLRSLLDAHHLSAPAAHVPIPRDWSPVLDGAEALGHKWLVVPWVGPEVRASLDGWRRLADQLNEAGQLTQRRGMRMAYHNHDFEFTPTEGQLPLDVLAERVDASLVDFELDIYWAVKAGQEPRALLARLPNRFPLWHLKDAGPAPARDMRDVGAGTIDFGSLFALPEARTLRHAFIEHDEPAQPLASVRASASALQRLP